ncbi:MAG: hypothetical protein EOP84_28125, partial [Verrucomicrobiaceae bacterium]
MTIVPQSRLILWAAFILVPFAIVAGAVPGGFSVAVGVIVAFLLVSVFDAASTSGSLKGFSVTGPSLVRLQKGREGGLDLILEHANVRGSVFRVGLDLPEEVGSESVDLTVRLKQDAERSALFWPCKPRERGKFMLEHAFVEAPSRLG